MVSACTGCRVFWWCTGSACQDVLPTLLDMSNILSVADEGVAPACAAAELESTVVAAGCSWSYRWGGFVDDLAFLIPDAVPRGTRAHSQACVAVQTIRNLDGVRLPAL